MGVLGSRHDWCGVGWRGHGSIDLLDGVHSRERLLYLADEGLPPWSDDIGSSADLIQGNQLSCELMLEHQDFPWYVAHVVGVQGGRHGF